MQEINRIIQDGCLINFMAKYILKGPTGGGKRELYNFTWEELVKYDVIFNKEYRYEDARFLLQLSMMITEANYLGRDLNVPRDIEDYPLIYEICPIIKGDLKIISPLILRDISSRSEPHRNALGGEDFGAGKDNNTLGHVLYSEQANIIFIIFTGTSNICMEAIDLSYYQTETKEMLNYVPGLKAHSGIYLGYMSIRNKMIEIIKKYITRNPRIIISGHSLGGAISQLCALDLAYYDPIHYSFATPQIYNQMGHDVFMKLVKYNYRIANNSDIVVYSPLPVMPNDDIFLHVGNLIYFQRNMCNYTLNHTLAYKTEFNI